MTMLVRETASVISINLYVLAASCLLFTIRMFFIEIEFCMYDTD
jgi:hypothetical protein